MFVKWNLRRSGHACLSFLSQPFGVSWLFVATFLLLQHSQLLILVCFCFYCYPRSPWLHMRHPGIQQEAGQHRLAPNSYVISLSYFAVSVLSWLGKAWVYIKGESRKNGLGAPPHPGYGTVKQCPREREQNLTATLRSGQRHRFGHPMTGLIGVANLKNYFTFMEALYGLVVCSHIRSMWFHLFVFIMNKYIVLVYTLLDMFIYIYIICKLKSRYSICVHISSTRRLGTAIAKVAALAVFTKFKINQRSISDPCWLHYILVMLEWYEWFCNVRLVSRLGHNINNSKWCFLPSSIDLQKTFGLLKDLI